MMKSGNQRKHDPARNAERLKKLNKEGGESVQKSQKEFQKSSRPMQSPGSCRLCNRVGCDGNHSAR